MKITSVSSSKKSVAEAVADIKKQLEGFDAKMLVYFASVSYNHEQVAEAIFQAFVGVTTFGCSSAYEFTEGKFLEDSIVAMAFSSEAIQDVKLEIVQGIGNGASVRKALESFSKYYGEPIRDMDYMKYIGIIMFDGLRMAEERIMDEIGDLTNITFIGGSASDKFTFTGTYVYANGKVYSDAVLLAVLKPATKFDIIKTQSFEVLDTVFTASETVPEKREVGRFNGKNAFDAYVEAIGQSAEKVNQIYTDYPVGIMALNDVFVHAVMGNDGKKMSFYSSILEGMEVNLLKATDIVKDTKKAVEDKKVELGGISGIIDFHCLGRTDHLQRENRTQEYVNIFLKIPTIGFSTYGEQYIGHVNQTSTMIVFK
ncbi:MAG TPA: FIST N-terminal domain-containing protein [Bacillota bacterium]|nr:FIST N-terminal domain-containing protein [Bacillota bacterium]